MHAVWKVDAVNHVEEVMSGQKKCRAQRIVGIATGRLGDCEGQIETVRTCRMYL